MLFKYSQASSFRIVQNNTRGRVDIRNRNDLKNGALFHSNSRNVS